VLDENVEQSLSRLLKLKEMNPILKALLKLDITANLFKLLTLACFSVYLVNLCGHFKLVKRRAEKATTCKDVTTEVPMSQAHSTFKKT